MSPGLRKLALTAHVTVSVGWLGAVVAFLALAIAGLSSGDTERVRASYLAMDMIGWWAIVPASIVSLGSGVVMSLGTDWGLLRHYWVVIKLVLTVLATAVLLLHMGPIAHVANLATTRPLIAGDLANVRAQLVGDAVAALVVLLAATVLSVFKPRGMTRYGRRRVA